MHYMLILEIKYNITMCCSLCDCVCGTFGWCNRITIAIMPIPSLPHTSDNLKTLQTLYSFDGKSAMLQFAMLEY